MTLRQLAIEIFILAAIGAMLGLLGPFSTFTMPLGWRLAYWIGFVLAGYAIYRPVQSVAQWLAEETAVPQWTALLIAAALATLPLTFAIGFAMSGMRYNPAILGDAFLPLYLQVFGIGLAIQFVMRAVFFTSKETHDPGDPDFTAVPKPLSVHDIPPPPAPTAPFLQRLPQDIGHNLVCLEMQDHYVKAHTLSGSAMVLIRMSDAIAELDGIEGLQTHRSWWVARSEVRAIKRDGRNMRLELTNGLLAPVARNRQINLKNAGWL